MTDQANSKDVFFKQLGILADDMIKAHGRDFTMGALVIAARFIAEGKSLGDQSLSDPPQ
jgi:hypothetical protein